MKKRVFILLFVSVILIASFIAAADNLTSSQKVDNAYKCLSDKVSDCSKLSLEQKTFTVLADGKCKSSLMGDSSQNECWPSGGCTVMSTAQATIALKNSGSDVSKEKAWLETHNSTPTDLNWYLEIDSSGSTICTITYPGGNTNGYQVGIKSDKTLTGGAGSCLSLSDNNYWLKVSSSCYNKEFDISCDKGFLTTLLFKNSGSSTVHVTEDTSSASADGTTTEKVNSLCFSDKPSGACSYGGSLWAAMSLSMLGKDVSPYMPYLITKSEDSANQKFIPDSFLYFLTGDSGYFTSVKSQQQSSQWWSASGDKYYDTAAALFPISQDFQEKTNSKDWLLNSQGSDGCWNSGNIRDTAFILASLWPEGTLNSGGGGTPGCESSGYYCVSGPSSCASAGGNLEDGYSCLSATSVCCSAPEQQQSCSELGGTTCFSGQVCSTSPVSASDTTSCCTGTCQEQTSQSDCELQGGICRSSCLNSESPSALSCSPTGGSCCITSSPSSSSGSSLWIWILLILIVLAVVGIIFREKLRMLWFRMKHRGGSHSSSSSGPGKPGPRPPPIMRPERRILFSPPREPRPGPRPKPISSKSQKELDDVLKKLKDMSK